MKEEVVMHMADALITPLVGGTMWLASFWNVATQRGIDDSSRTVIDRYNGDGRCESCLNFASIS